VGQLLDIESPRGDFGRHQRRDLVLLEIRERTHAGALTLVAVNGSRQDATAFQLLGQAVGTVLGTRKHQHLMPVTLIDQVRQQMALLLLGHTVDLLIHAIGRRVTRGDLDGGWIAQDPRGQIPNLVRVCRGEQQILPLLRQELDDAADGLDEPHVEHPVGFIEHEALYAAQVERALLRQIEQASRRGNEQITALFESINLRIDAHAAENNSGAHTNIFAVNAGAVGNLCRELAGRRQYERTRSAPGGLAELL
jgi:hypothetical protein